jgi:SnoaL-like polyketide cyclase
MSEENKATVRRLMEEGFSQGHTEVVDEVLNPDFVCYDPNSESGEVRGSETIKGEIEYFRNAVPDLTYTSEDQIAEGEGGNPLHGKRHPPGGVLRRCSHWGADHDVGNHDRPLGRRQDGGGEARIRPSRGDAPARSGSCTGVGL